MTVIIALIIYSYCMMIFMKRKMTDYSENITQIEENIKERKR